jgi:hypothetical protein
VWLVELQVQYVLLVCKIVLIVCEACDYFQPEGQSGLLFPTGNCFD